MPACATPAQVEVLLQSMQDRFQKLATDIVARIDGLGSRINQLEGQIEALVNHAESEPAPANKQAAG